MGKLLKVAVGLSGGVDSAVAISLLKRAGHEVVGLTMLTYDGALGVKEGPREACYGPGEEEDVAACQRLCDSLGVEYRAIDLRKEYSDRVLSYFRSEYLKGRTPNPCVRCNSELKFGFLLDRARERGVDFDVFATGHYARIVKSDGRDYLAKAVFEAKDQTYFIWRLDRARLASIMFPLGGFTKAEVREAAREFGLQMAEKLESQDFVAGKDYAPLFEGERLEPGDIVDDSGKVLGRHRGIVHYTIGQRRGLGIASSAPLYVKEIDAKGNRVIVSDDASLFRHELVADDALLADGELRDRPFRATVRIRQNQKPAEAEITALDEGSIRVEFDAAQRGIAPGQSAVIYRDGLVLGGGVIR